MFILNGGIKKNEQKNLSAHTDVVIYKHDYLSYRNQC